MYWPLLAAAVLLAIACYQFGSMAVWITVLSITLKTVLLAVAVVALVSWGRASMLVHFQTA